MVAAPRVAGPRLTAGAGNVSTGLKLFSGRPKRLRIAPIHIAVIVTTLAACNLPLSQATVSEMSWVDLVRIDGISYMANGYVTSGAPDSDDLGPVHATVEFQIAGRVHAPNYRVKDGDATLLEEGTPLFAVAGYAPTTRLAAVVSGGVVLYEADRSPTARTGSDLLDLGGKVEAISVNSEVDGTTEFARIEVAATIAGMVAMVLEAPVDQSLRENTGERYFIAFHLNDGTRIVRAYWPASGELSRGMHVPEGLRWAVEQALIEAGATPAVPSN